LLLQALGIYTPLQYYFEKPDLMVTKVLMIFFNGTFIFLNLEIFGCGK